MTLEANNLAVDDDLNTTAPNAQPDAWKMPEPVFKKTSGRLPGGFAKHAAPSDATHTSSAPIENADSSPAPVHVEPTPKSPTLKIVIVALGIAAMVAFIVVFLTVVYFFFLRG